MLRMDQIHVAILENDKHVRVDGTFLAELTSDYCSGNHQFSSKTDICEKILTV